MRRRLLASQRYNGIDVHRASRRDSTGKERNDGQDHSDDRETKWIMLIHTVHLTGDESGHYPAAEKQSAFFENHPEDPHPRSTKRETHADLAVSLLNSVGDDAVQSCGRQKKRCRSK